MLPATEFCAQCGTALTPNARFCAQCGQSVSGELSTSSGGCEIDGCGVPAVGRCRECRRRFCQTHQAWDKTPPGKYDIYLDPGREPYLDWCTACQRASHERAAEERTRVEAEKQETQQSLLKHALQLADRYERVVLAAKALEVPAVIANESTKWCEPFIEVLDQARVPGEGTDAFLHGVAGWFVVRAKGRIPFDESIEIIEARYEKPFGRKRRYVKRTVRCGPGWTFKRTVMHYPDEGGSYLWEEMGCITEDALVAHRSSGGWRDSALSLHDLPQLADRLGLHGPS